MFVINFDFSEYHYHFKFAAVNIPVILTELITYPLQRVQTQLVTKDAYIAKSQISEAKLILKQMFTVEKFPKLLHGVRYSFDFSITQMTAKFFMFDFLMSQSQNEQPIAPKGISSNQESEFQNQSKLMIYAKCVFANTFATVLSQAAFTYQIIASSLPTNHKNRHEDVREKLKQFTVSKKLPALGLKYTVPTSMYNTCLQIILIQKLSQFFNKNRQTESYFASEFFTALTVLTLTGFANHFAFLRQVELAMSLPIDSINYQKGLLGTLLRHSLKGATLYGLYFAWFEFESRRELRGEILEEKQNRFNKLPGYRK